MSEQSRKVENTEKRKIFHWRKKRVSEKVYRNKIRIQNVGKTFIKKYGTRSLINNFKSSVNRDEPVAIEEYYIIHIETLGKQNFAKIVGLYFLC